MFSSDLNRTQGSPKGVREVQHHFDRAHFSCILIAARIFCGIQGPFSLGRTLRLHTSPPLRGKGCSYNCPGVCLKPLASYKIIIPILEFISGLIFKDTLALSMTCSFLNYCS